MVTDLSIKCLVGPHIEHESRSGADDDGDGGGGMCYSFYMAAAAVRGQTCYTYEYVVKWMLPAGRSGMARRARGKMDGVWPAQLARAAEVKAAIWGHMRD